MSVLLRIASTHKEIKEETIEVSQACLSLSLSLSVCFSVCLSYIESSTCVNVCYVFYVFIAVSYAKSR